jgi:hypothetical protein
MKVENCEKCGPQRLKPRCSESTNGTTEVVPSRVAGLKYLSWRTASEGGRYQPRTDKTRGGIESYVPENTQMQAA